nr:5202_t:CDS:2 [Entrophospora candida]
MFWQLFPDSEVFRRFILTCEAPTLWEALRLIARHEKKDMKQISVILVVDDPEYLTEGWNRLEHFIATFCSLKSKVLCENELTTISEIHAGTRLHLNDDSEFKNHHLKLKCAIHHVNTNSATCGKKEWILNVKVHVSMFGKVNIITNAQSAPYCDSFLGLDQSKNNNPNEVHQAKRWKLKSPSLNDYQNERNKPARDKDFLFFLQLPKLQFRTSDGLWDRGWLQTERIL